MKDICFPVIDDQRWLSNIDNTHWLDHLHHILSGAVRIADKVGDQDSGQGKRRLKNFSTYSMGFISSLT